MKKIVKLSFISLLLCGCENNQNSDNSKNANKNDNSVSISRTSITKSLIDDTSLNNPNNNSRSPKVAQEKELASFSTPLTSGVANRIVNIKLTCGKINERILQNGETFSFNQIVGPCTAEEGYKEAEIYVNKQIQYALGGGNCQVSTTLYNAVLAVPRN